MNKRYGVMIVLLVMFGVVYTSNVPAQMQEKSCTQRDQFETEEEFQRRCPQVGPPPPTITAMPVLQYETNSCTELLNLTQTQFEKNEEFLLKRQQAIKKFNEQVAQHDRLCQAGIGTLGQYAVYTEFYAINIQWQRWTNRFMAIEHGSISLSREEAKSLYQKSEPQHQFPVFFTVNVVGDNIVADNVVLMGLDKAWEVLLTVNPLTVEEKAINVIELLNPQQDRLENKEQYYARCQTLIKRYNEAVNQRDPRYQAGTAVLRKDEYNYGKFSVPITWQGWAQQAFDLLSKNHIAATQEQAVALIREGEEKPVFVLIEVAENQSRVMKPVVIGLNTLWSLQSLETNTHIRQKEAARKAEQEAQKAQARENCKNRECPIFYEWCKAYAERDPRAKNWGMAILMSSPAVVGNKVIRADNMRKTSDLSYSDCKKLERECIEDCKTAESF